MTTRLVPVEVSGAWAGSPPDGAGGRAGRGALRLRARSWLLLAACSLIGVVAFGWPLLSDPSGSASTAHAADAPWLLALLLPLLLAVVLAELAEGALDAKAVALLGVLAACGAALRLPSGGVAGFEPVFFLLIPAGRVLGRGFGFVLGALTLFVSALLTGGVGPWLPFQMLGAAWMGFFAGCLPPLRGRAEVLMLAAYGAVAALAYGLLLNLSFWPYVTERRLGAVVRARRRAGREPAPLLGVPPRHVARLRHPPGRVHRRLHPRRRSADPRRPAPGVAPGRVRCPGGVHARGRSDRARSIVPETGTI